MEEALAAIRRAISEEEPANLSRRPGETAIRCWIAVSQCDSRNWLCVQPVDRSCEEARADTRRSCPRNAPPYAEVMVGRKSAPHC